MLKTETQNNFYATLYISYRSRTVVHMMKLLSACLFIVYAISNNKVLGLYYLVVVA